MNDMEIKCFYDKEVRGTTVVYTNNIDKEVSYIFPTEPEISEEEKNKYIQAVIKEWNDQLQRNKKKP